MRKLNRENIDRFFEYNLHIESRTIYMGTGSCIDGEESGIDAHLSEKMIKALHILDQKSEDPITIIMNNNGGSTEDGLAIFDAIRLCKSHITIIVFGKAYSMGSVILQSADKRIMTINSRIMLHYGEFSMSAKRQDVYKWIDDSKKDDDWMENLFLKRIQEKNPGISKKQIQKMLQTDLLLTAEEAVEMGLADEIR